MSYTIGLVAIVQDELRAEALRLWNLSAEKYNSRGVQAFAHPNLSFQGGQCDDLDILKEAIAELSKNLEPFEIVVDGFGYFERPSKTIYFRVVKTEELTLVHQRINEVLSICCSQVFKMYSPENWVPHITLAMGDLTDDNFYEFKKDLEGQEPHYVQLISELQVLRVHSDGKIELIESFKCTRKS